MLTLPVTVPSEANADRLTIVASVFPLYDFAREVAGKDADVSLLLPPGVGPHTWEPKPSDIARVSKADMFFYVSDLMEPWAHNLVSAVKRKNILVVEILKNLGIQGSEDTHGGEGPADPGQGHPADPHFWLDPSLSARAIKIIGETMARQDPPNGPAYTARAEGYAQRMRDLDAAYAAALANCRSRLFVTGGHSAFGYLANRYDLVQISLYGISPDSEPTPAHLASVVKMIREKGLKVVFAEELVNPRLASVLAAETGVSTRVLIPAGNITPRRMELGTTLIQIMEENLQNLREGLVCE